MSQCNLHAAIEPRHIPALIAAKILSPIQWEIADPPRPFDISQGLGDLIPAERLGAGAGWRDEPSKVGLWVSCWFGSQPIHLLTDDIKRSEIRDQDPEGYVRARFGRTRKVVIHEALAPKLTETLPLLSNHQQMQVHRILASSQHAQMEMPRTC